MGAATDGAPRTTPCWADVTLPDVEAGKRFYGGLFGWTFEEGDPEAGPYARALHEGAEVAALAPKPDGRMPTAWCVYFSSPDAEATAERIRAEGGQVVTGPAQAGPYGTLLLAADPGGAVFGVWQAAAHRGFGKRGTPGAYGWAEVYTREPAAVDAFYERVFGLTAHDLGESGESGEPGEPGDAGEAAGFDYAVWTPAGEPLAPEHAVGGRAVMDEASFPAAMPAHFLVYFVVADCDEACRAARRLGGRIRREARDSAYGRFAVLTDDQGADFAVVDPARPGEG
ncbi:MULTISPECIES: VOC family protein [Streptomyces]|uniref:VOC family protein n=1 Tax=Streptomyces TaxID=1883 RepID=UPI00163C865F|nr:MULTISPECIES: VOC family protein [Streptomyces]MBC2875965.1 VOC family protein [Streptomyces sp. TYQ1024]UBI38333.1 VOC family protein [Streptomyces mobaraensis]UKW30917.1 VOC family protein [Streptomyces sp. TYQ1024]